MPTAWWLFFSRGECGGKMAEVNCLPSIEGTLTVGTVFTLACEGALPKLKSDKLAFRLDEADKYKLQLLSFEQNDNKALFKVTSYKAGEHHLKKVQLLDGDTAVILGDFDFTVESVLKKEEAKPEPYGPIGPMMLSLPWWYYGLWAAFFLALAFWIFRRVKRRLEKKKLIEEINAFGSSLSPYHFFTQSVRRFLREYSFFTQPDSLVALEERQKVLEEMEKTYRIFIGRSFQVPALQWREDVFLKDIRKRYPGLFAEKGDEMKKIFHEYERAKNHTSTMKAKDIIQILDLSRKSADAIYLSLKAEAHS
jgi:hypothetical protein